MSNGRILVAEDDRQLLRSLGIRLRAAGYEVVEAQDGYQAVAFASKQVPDLLLLEVNMPAGDGFSVQKRLWKMPSLRRTPVVYITGDSAEALDTRAHEMGAVAVLRKPFETADLLATIKGALTCETVESPGQW
jgi:DNA-binding response OmpR family regulator